MVPHSSICAKPKRYKNTESPEILAGDCQKTHKFACPQPYSRPSAEVSRQELLHLCQPAQSPAKERAGHAQIPDIGNRQYQTTSNNRLAGRKPSYAIFKRTYNEMSGTLEITRCSAAGPVNPDGDHTRNCGSSTPDQRIQEPHFDLINQAQIPNYATNANNRPDQTVVAPETQQHSPYYASQAQGNST